MNLKNILFPVLVSFSGILGAQELVEFSAAISTNPPVIDGVIAPDEWKDALVFDGFFQNGGNRLEWRSAKAFLTADEKNIYLAQESELPPDGSLVSVKHKNIVSACFEDIMEFFINPAPGKAGEVNYHLLINGKGLAEYDANVKGKTRKPDWSKAGVEFKQVCADGKWTAEVKIPLSVFGRPLTGAPWSFSICRSWMRPLLFSSIPGKFDGSNVRVVFAKENPVIQFAWKKDPFLRDMQAVLSVRNSSAQAGKWTAKLLLTNNSMPETRTEETVSLAPGEKKEFALSVEAGHTCKEFEFTASLKNELGTECFPVHYEWTIPPRQRKWQIGNVQVKAFDFEIAYYPTSGKLRVENHLRSYKKTLPEQVSFSVVEEKTGKIVKSGTFPAVDRKNSYFQLPELNGIYKVIFELNGEKLEKKIERKHFEWENNQLGMSRKVYPPFTDMTVNGNTIGTVLREHRLSGSGLPEQIKIKGTEFLDGPIQLVSGGKPVAGTLTFTEKSADRVKTESVLPFGKTAGTWEYDGNLLYELTLNPGNYQDLTLEVPVKGEFAQYLYAGILRDIEIRPLAGKSGTLWKSTEPPLERQVPAGFAHWAFVGSGLRGICIYAENDKNWGWKEGTPNMDLIRRGKAVVLRLHLINQPTAVPQARTLSFGMIAAPVKPRPADAATRWMDRKYTVLGTDINWLAGPGNCACVYPPGRNEFFWEALAKANVEPVLTQKDREERSKLADQLIRIAEPYFKPYDVPEYWKGYIRTINHRIVRGASYGRSMIFYYNRSVYNGLDEYPTFMNEWTTADFEARNYALNHNEIFIVPSKSYIDYSLYWHKRSFKYRNNGIYWDNCYLIPSYNTEMTDAYQRADGTVIPAAGIRQLRELMKRAFVMMNEEGLPPVTLPHMTSLNIIPALSFATYQLDWEWKRSAGPVQERFSREYCQLVSNGELNGAICFVCGDSGPQAEIELIQRSFAGVCMIHQLDRYNSQYESKPLTAMNVAIWKKYLHEPGVKTYRYWDEVKSPEYAISNPKVPYIIHTIPGEKTVIGLCSYSNQEENVTITFPKGQAVSDFETDTAVPAGNGTLSLKMAPYEVRTFEFKNTNRKGDLK